MVNIGGSAWNFRVIEKLFPNSSQFLPSDMDKETKKAAPREEGTAFFLLCSDFDAVLFHYDMEGFYFVVIQ